MSNKERVIYDIERCICCAPAACQDCSKYEYGNECCMEELLSDALDLLREQEPVEPKKEPDKIVCGVCGEKLVEICGDVNVV